MTKIIGIAGFKDAGKDTVATILCGGGVTASPIDPLGPANTTLFDQDPLMVRAALGDPLRDVCSILYGFTPEDYTNRTRKDGAPRKALRDVAQHLRKLDPHIWLRPMARTLATLRDDQTLVITDVRQRSEYEFVRKAGGEIWGVYRPGVISDGHETELLPLFPERFDRVLWNGGTPKDLHLRIRGEDRPFAVGVLVAMPDGLIAVGRKNGGFTEPGGKVESTDRTARDALCRELYEETGLSVAPEEPNLIEVRATNNGDGLGGREFWQYMIHGERVARTVSNAQILARICKGQHTNQEGQVVRVVTQSFLSDSAHNPFASTFLHTLRSLSMRSRACAHGFDWARESLA